MSNGNYESIANALNGNGPASLSEPQVQEPFSHFLPATARLGLPILEDDFFGTGAIASPMG